MKKSLLLSLPVAAFVAGMAVVPSVFATDGITTWAGLEECLKSPAETTCTLGDADIDAAGQTTIEVTGTKTLDLNGKKIFNEASSGAAKGLFSLGKDTNLTIQNGTLNAGENAAGIRVNGAGDDSTAAAGSTKLTIAQNATLTDTAIVIYDNGKGANYGSQVDIYGTLNGDIVGWALQTNGNIANMGANTPIINIHDSAVVNTGHNAGLYLGGYGVMTIDKATITAPSGIIVKSGVLNLNGATIHATGEYKTGEPYGNGAKATGAAVQIEVLAGEVGYVGQVDVNINSGTSLTSEQGNAIQAYGNASDKIKEISLEGENIVLQSAPGLPVLGVTGQIAETPPKVTFDGEPIDLEAITTAWDSIPDPEVVPTPAEPEETITNPNTADSIALYTTIAVLSLVGLGTTIFAAKKTRR